MKTLLLIIYRILRTLYFKLDEYHTRLSSFSLAPCSASFQSFLSLKPLPSPHDSQECATFIIQQFLNHHFDLLGTGWRDWSLKNQGLSRVDLVKKTNLTMAEKIAVMIDDPDYRPMDWHCDIKKPYRWKASAYHRNLRVQKNGVDIKVPWELGRLQHLPQLALFVNKRAEYHQSALYLFKHHILDFISQNPLKMGVQWVCTMDVAIRAANMAVAFDLYRQLPNSNNILDPDFENIFKRALKQHAHFIRHHLEYYQKLRSNHYLANIAGLLFACAYLDHDDDCDRWLAFAIQEIFLEFRQQFHPDGSNFEASTSYHRLSSEMILYSLALILGLKKERISRLLKLPAFTLDIFKQIKYKANLLPYIKDDSFHLPDWVQERLFRSLEFTQHTRHPCSAVAQIGDHDNGRFFKFSCYGTFSHGSWHEDFLNHQALIDAHQGLLASGLQNQSLESNIVRSFSQSKTYHSPSAKKPLAYFKSPLLNNFLHDCPHHKKHAFSTDSEGDLRKNLKLFYYSDFGLFILQSNYLHLTLSACHNGQLGHGGHAHNDRLSITLSLHNKLILQDPGTGLYTPDTVIRNQFRSSAFHNGPVARGEEQNRWMDGEKGLFSLYNEAICEFLAYDSDSLAVGLCFRSFKFIRQVKILEKKVEIVDQGNTPFECCFFPPFYSPSYGKISKLSKEAPSFSHF